MERIARPRFFYGWIVVVSGFLIHLGTTWSPSTFSIVVSPLEQAFGWSRTTVSALASWSSLGYGGSAYPGAWLADKYGARLPIVLAAVFTGVSLMLMSRISSLGLFSLLYVTSGLTGLVFAVGPSIIQRWFKLRRGLTLGLISAGGAVGMLIYPILIRWVMDTYSWREGYMVMAVMVFVIFLLAAFLMVDRPEKLGLQPYGVTGGVAPAGAVPRPAAAPQAEWSVREALKTRALILLLLTNFLLIVPGFMINVHLMPFAEDLGISRSVAAAAQGVRGIVGILGSIAAGALAEVVGWKRGLVIFTALGGLSILWLLATRNAWMLWVFVLVFGFLQSGTMPLSAGITGSYFGTRFLTKLIALNRISSMCGTAIGPVIGGLIYDSTGSYTAAFVIGAIMWGVAAVAMAAIAEPHKKALAAPQKAGAL